MVASKSAWTVIFAAEEAELMALRPKLQHLIEVKVGPYAFYQGLWHHQPVMLALTGVGKVAAAATCATIFSAYPVLQVFNIGTAGGLSRVLHIEDIVLATEVAHADVDLTILGSYQYGQLPGLPARFVPSNDMRLEILPIFQSLNQKIHEGLMLAGDMFLHPASPLMSVVKQQFGDENPLSFDMESAAVAQCCTIYQKPFGIIRVISDIIGNSDQVMQYQEVVQRSSYVLAEVFDKWFLFHQEGET